MTIDDMRERFRMLLASAGQHENATDALARRINRCLMLFEDRLYDLASGEYVELVSPGIADSGSVADAAARLLRSSQADAECIMLLLPPTEFLANHVNMPGLSPDAMRDALQLQAITQLPELEQQLNLALTSSSESATSGRALAWWIPAARTSELFKAFSMNSLFLAAVMPRPAWLMAGLARAAPGHALTILDSDRQMLTVIANGPRSGSDEQVPLSTCLQTAADDLLDTALNQHWQTELAQAGIEKIDYDVSSADDYLRLARQHSLQDVDYRTAATAAFPAPALDARHQLDRGRRRGVVVKAVAATIALAILPFSYQSWQLSRLDRQLADIRVLSADARQHQAAVREFESQWGVMTEFPDQDVSAAMLALQNVINPGVLNVFEIDEGFISIEGESEDPQNVLEQLEQNQMFTEVDFARATNNNRYYIDLRLTTVNFPAYQEWHFPERR